MNTDILDYMMEEYKSLGDCTSFPEIREFKKVDVRIMNSNKELEQCFTRYWNE